MPEVDGLKLKLDSSAFKRQVLDSGNALDLLAVSGTKAEAAVKNFSDALDSATSATGRTVEEQKKLQDSYDELTSSLSLQTVALGIGAASFTALTAAVIDGTAASIEFQAGLANVGTLIPGNTERLKELGESVKSLSLETGQSTQDLTGGLYNLVSAFGESADSAAQLDNVAKTAAAGLSTTTEAINLISAVTKGFGDTSLEAQKKVSDLALVTVREGQTTFGELASAIGRTTGSSNELKISQEELFASFAALTGNIGNTAEVSTSLSAINAALIKGSPILDKAIKDLGFSTGKAAIETLGYQSALKGIYDELGQDSAQFAKALGSVEAFKGAIVLAKDETGKYAKSLVATKDAAGTMGQAFKEQTEGVNTLGFQLSRVKSAFEVLRIEVGDALAPALKTVVDLAFSVGSVIGSLGVTVDKVAVAFVALSTAGSALGAVALVKIAAESSVAQAALFGLSEALLKGKILAATYGGTIVTLSKSLGAATIAIASFSKVLELGEEVKGWIDAENELTNALEAEAEMTDRVAQKRKDWAKATKEAAEAEAILKASMVGLSEKMQKIVESTTEIQLPGIGDKTFGVRTGQGDEDFIKKQQEKIVSLEAERMALQETSTSMIGLEEATLKATLAASGNTKLTQSQIVIALQNAKAIDQSTLALKDSKAAIQEQEREERKRLEAQEKLNELVSVTVGKLQEEVDTSNKSADAVGLTTSETIKAAESKAMLEIQTGKLKDATDAEKATIIGLSKSLDESNQKLKEREEQQKKNEAAEAFIKGLEDENLAIQDQIDGITRLIIKDKAYIDATSQQKKAIEELVKTKETLTADLFIKNLEEEINSQTLSSLKLREKTALQKLGTNATEKQIEQVKELVALENQQTFEQKLDALRAELALQKLSNDEREREIQLREMGFKDATEIQKKQAIELQKQIDAQKEANEKIKKDKEQMLASVEKIGSKSDQDLKVASIAEVEKKEPPMVAATKQDPQIEENLKATKSLEDELQTTQKLIAEVNDKRDDSLEQEVVRADKEEELNNNLITSFEERRKAQLESEKAVAESFKAISAEIDTSMKLARDSVGKLADQAKSIESALTTIRPKKTVEQYDDDLGNLRKELLSTKDIEKRMELTDKARDLTLKRFEDEKKAAEDLAETQRQVAKDRISLLTEEQKKQQDSFAAFSKVAASLDQSVQDILLGDTSILSGEQKLATVQERFKGTTEAALGGDVEAASRLGTEGKALLDIASEQLRSSPAFAEIFQGVRDTLEQVGAFSEKKAEGALSQSDYLDSQIKVQERGLDIQADISAAQKRAEDVLIQLRDLNAQSSNEVLANLNRLVQISEQLLKQQQTQSTIQANTASQSFANLGI